jgi:hypothetical protein
MKRKSKRNNVIEINKANQKPRLNFSITEMLDEETLRDRVNAYTAHSALEALTNSPIAGNAIDQEQAETMLAAAGICRDIKHDFDQYRESMGWNKKIKEA